MNRGVDSMGEYSPSEQEREDQLQVVLSEYVNFPEQTQAHDQAQVQADKSFEQVMDQAFDQASTHQPGKRRIWPSRGNEEAGTPLSGVPGLRMMGF